MNISVDNALVDDPLIRLRNNGNQIVEKNDDHKHCLEDPYEPDEGCDRILFIICDLIFFVFLYPALVYRRVHITDRITKAIQEVTKI